MVKPASKYRSRMKIYVDILESIRMEDGKARFTKILYNANLSYHRLQKYLTQLEEKELLIRSKNTESEIVWYELTEKAYQFLPNSEKSNAS